MTEKQCILRGFKLERVLTTLQKDFSNQYYVDKMDPIEILTNFMMHGTLTIDYQNIVVHIY